MRDYPFEKKPAFFPFVTAEVFFEAEETELDLSKIEALDTQLDAELDAELDELLATR